MSGWVDKWMYEWIDEWINGQTDEQDRHSGTEQRMSLTVAMQQVKSHGML